MTTKILQSPLNYTGGKYRLLPRLLPLFPKNINSFLDLFCGGCNVGLNVTCNHVIFNDSNENLISLYKTFGKLGVKLVLEKIYNIISKYELSLVSLNGYSYYGCKSATGLGKYNKERYSKLRNDLNNRRKLGILDDNYFIMLYVLIVYAFNNQIRFNSKGEFNLPVGKRDFSKKIEQKLCSFIDMIQNDNVSFTCRDFRNFNISDLSSQDFVYVDPPYLITCATYNEQGGWNEQYEKELLSFLDNLDNNHIRFALSNVLRSKGKENKILIDWLDKNYRRFKTTFFDFSYANSNYQTKDKSSVSEEILVTNY